MGSDTDRPTLAVERWNDTGSLDFKASLANSLRNASPLAREAACTMDFKPLNYAHARRDQHRIF